MQLFFFLIPIASSPLSSFGLVTLRILSSWRGTQFPAQIKGARLRSKPSLEFCRAAGNATPQNSLRHGPRSPSLQDTGHIWGLESPPHQPQQKEHKEPGLCRSPWCRPPFNEGRLEEA